MVVMRCTFIYFTAGSEEVEEDPMLSINDIIKEECIRVEEENRSLATFNAHLTEKLQVMGAKVS
jgi:hypothetical protein